MRARLISLWETLHASYWFVPSLMAVTAVLLAYLMLQVDEALGTTRANEIEWLYTGGADGARAVLSAIAASTIGVAGTTFSITIAALTLASGQFGPRLLRNFMRDTGNQIVLGTFIATFLYSLLTLRSVRSIDELEFVPHVAVSVSLLLAMASVGVLIYFIHHVASSIQAANVITTAARELDDAIGRLFPETAGRGEEAPETPPAGSVLPVDFEYEAAIVPARGSGYLLVVDADRLIEIARERDMILRLAHRPGDFVVEGTPLARIWPRERNDDRLIKAVNDAMVLGAERSVAQDLEFPINQLVEIAVRALSPGVNDPFTAITCIDRLSTGLCRLAGRKFPSPYRYDEENTLRLIARPFSFSGAVDAAFDQIRQYGRASVAVTIRLLDAIAVVAGCTRTDEQRAVLRRHAEMIAHGGKDETPEESDRAEIGRRFAAALAAIDRSC